MINFVFLFVYLFYMHFNIVMLRLCWSKCETVRRLFRPECQWCGACEGKYGILEAFFHYFEYLEPVHFRIVAKNLWKVIAIVINNFLFSEGNLRW